MRSDRNTKYDAIVIGSGQAGTPLALAMAHAGRRTALIESTHVGGTCVNVGCTPTKTLIASARVAHLAARAGDYGVECADCCKVDFRRVMDRVHGMVESFRSGSERRLRETRNVELIAGEGRFVGPNQVEALMPSRERRLCEAPLVFINVGARPRRPTLDGLDEVEVLDSTSILGLDLLPDHLIILGGGYIGVEYGQAFRRLGSRVTIIQRRSQLLTREDPEIADAVADLLRSEGVRILFDATPVLVEPGRGGGMILTLESNGERTIIEGPHLLAAVGRTPNSDRLNLEAAGVEVDEQGYIRVNDRLETNVPGIYALGDVKGGPAFTHTSYDDFRIVRTNLLEGGALSKKDRLVPYTVFTDPQLGRIGLSERQAVAAGIPFHVASMPMEYVASALERGESKGLMKVIVHAATGRILGAAVLGIEGGEVMTMLQLAMMGDLSYARLRDAVFTHPSLAEALNNLFASIED